MFANRVDAGRRLGEELARLSYPAPHVFGLARGGMPVAAEVAKVLDAPLDVVVVRKISLPSQPELALGAVAEGARGVVWTDDMHGYEMDQPSLQSAVETATLEVADRVDRYRGGRVLPDLDAGETTAIVVDDGLATGATAQAALQVVSGRDPTELVLAVPVCSPSSVSKVSGLAEVVCLEAPERFSAVGQFYAEFSQTTDDEVRDLLEARAV